MKKRFLLAVMITSAFSVQAYASPVGNMPIGIIADELQREREAVQNAGEVQAEFKYSVLDKESAEVKIYVKRINFIGDNESFELSLQKIAKEYLSADMTFGDLQRLCAKATEFLRSKGYLSAVSYLPPQTIEKNGAVTINIVLGTYNSIKLENTAKMKTSRVQSFVNVIKSGHTVEQRDMDRMLLTINDIPGIKAHGVMSPGGAPKTVDLSVDTVPLNKYDGYIFADNYGSSSTGNYRIGTTFQINQLNNIGDYLRMSFATTDKGTINYDVRYDVPIGSRGVHIGAAVYQTDYTLGDGWELYEAYGMSRTAEVFAIMPMKRTLNNNSFFETYYRYKHMEDRMDAFNYLSAKAAHEIEFKWRGDYRNNNSINSYAIAHSIGDLMMISKIAKEADYYRTAGGYQRTRGDFLRVQRLGNNLNLHVAMSGQYAWTPLNSSEKFYIGGPNGVRAFPQGEAGGDHGFLANLELRFKLHNPRWQIGPFIDYGWTKYNRNYSGVRNAAAVGLSILFSEPGKNSIKLDLATPISDPYSYTSGRDIKGRIWLQGIFKI